MYPRVGLNSLLERAGLNSQQSSCLRSRSAGNTRQHGRNYRAGPEAGECGVPAPFQPRRDSNSQPHRVGRPRPSTASSRPNPALTQKCAREKARRTPLPERRETPGTWPWLATRAARRRRSGFNRRRRAQKEKAGPLRKKKRKKCVFELKNFIWWPGQGQSTGRKSFPATRPEARDDRRRLSAQR